MTQPGDTDRMRRLAKVDPGSWAAHALVGLACLTGGGGAGTYLTSRSVEVEMAKMNGVLENIDEKLAEMSKWRADVDRRIGELAVDVATLKAEKRAAERASGNGR